MKAIYTINTEKNGIELFFNEKPETAIITTLKENGWRWHNVKKCWYTKQDENSLQLAQAVTNGEELPEAPGTTKSEKVAYYKNVSDYITLEEYRTALETYWNNRRHYYDKEEEKKRIIEYSLTNNYNSDSEYRNISKYIRQAIIWKSIGGEAEKFDCNGGNAQYAAIWQKLPTFSHLKPTDKKYSAMWGYDQTQITTATYYGKAFGLDVLVTGGFGSGEVLLKRIPKDGKFWEGCMYFSPNTFTEEEIDEVNTYVSYHGR